MNINSAETPETTVKEIRYSLLYFFVFGLVLPCKPNLRLLTLSYTISYISLL